MTWYKRVIAAHTAVTDAVSHAQRLKSSRYFVWQEDGANDLEAGNIHIEKAVTGTTDLFTKREFDPWKDAFEQSLDRSGLAWYLNSVQYEEDTGFWHYEWVWEVV
jgi:hypothetical protein